MSGRRTHRAIGILARGGYALAKAQEQRPEHLLLEVLSGWGSPIELDASTPSVLPHLA